MEPRQFSYSFAAAVVESGAVVVVVVIAGRVVVLRHVGQALDLEGAGRVKDGGKLLVGHAHLAVVHETEEGLHVAVLDVAKDDDRMLARVRLFFKRKEIDCPFMAREFCDVTFIDQMKCASGRQT